MAERHARQEKARQQNRSAQQREQRHQLGLQYKCKTAAEMRDSCNQVRASTATDSHRSSRRAAREAAGVVGKRSRPILCAHHAPVAACEGDDGFELYECDVCGKLQAVCVGQECSHVCGGAATEDSDTRDGEDGECDACGQLSAWCGQEWEYATTCISWDDLSDEQLPCGVYRDENGELYDEHY